MEKRTLHAHPEIEEFRQENTFEDDAEKSSAGKSQGSLPKKRKKVFILLGIIAAVLIVIGVTYNMISRSSSAEQQSAEKQVPKAEEENTGEIVEAEAADREPEEEMQEATDSEEQSESAEAEAADRESEGELQETTDSKEENAGVRSQEDSSEYPNSNNAANRLVYHDETYNYTITFPESAASLFHASNGKLTCRWEVYPFKEGIDEFSLSASGGDVFLRSLLHIISGEAGLEKEDYWVPAPVYRDDSCYIKIVVDEENFRESGFDALAEETVITLPDGSTHSLQEYY